MHSNQFDNVKQKLTCALTMLSIHSKSFSVVHSISCDTDTAFPLHSMYVCLIWHTQLDYLLMLKLADLPMLICPCCCVGRD